MKIQQNINNFNNQRTFGMRIIKPGEIIEAAEFPITRITKSGILGKYIDELNDFLVLNELNTDQIILDSVDNQKIYPYFYEATYATDASQGNLFCLLYNMINNAMVKAKIPIKFPPF